MFKLPKDIKHIPKGKICIPIDSFIKLYENNDEITLGKKVIGLKTDYLKFIYHYFKETNNLRCGICGVKASHFRIAKDNKLFLYCFKKVDGDCYYSIFNRDHVIPNCKKFSNEKDNLILTCEYCNHHRGSSKVKYTKDAIKYIDSQREKCLREYICELLGIAKHQTNNKKLKYISKELKEICQDNIFDEIIKKLKNKIYF